jgi:hypothetical protein
MRTCFSIVTLSFFFLACSTVSSRIREHASEFSSYPAGMQDQIQSGKIEPGFTEEMVYMAKGKPSRKLTLQEGDRHFVLWNYNRPTYVSLPGGGAGSLASPYGYPSFGPDPVRPVGTMASSPYFTVKFENGKVVDWVEDY